MYEDRILACARRYFCLEDTFVQAIHVGQSNMHIHNYRHLTRGVS